MDVGMISSRQFWAQVARHTVEKIYTSLNKKPIIPRSALVHAKPRSISDIICISSITAQSSAQEKKSESLSAIALRRCYTGRFLTQHCCTKNRYRVTWQSILCNNVVRIWSMFKVVQHVVATKVALKIVCRRHVTRIDFLCNKVSLKIVVKNCPVKHHLYCQRYFCAD